MSFLFRILVRAIIATTAALMVITLAWALVGRPALSTAQLAGTTIAFMGVFGAIALGRERDRLTSTSYNFGLPLFVGLLSAIGVMSYGGATVQSAVRVVAILASIAVGTLAIRLSERARVV